MNCSCACYRRLVWSILAFCFLADLTSGTEQQLKDLGLCIAKVEQHRSALKGSDEGIKRLAALDHYLEIMKAGADRIQELTGELQRQDERLRDLKRLELDPKQREVEQIRQATDARFSQLRYEKQSLETEIIQHNNKPHIFYDTQLAERANYIAETTALKARWQKLTEAAAAIQTEMQPRLDNAGRAATKARQDFSEASAKRDKTVQLAQEQTFHYANTRSLLIGQLDKMDREAAPAVLP